MTIRSFITECAENIIEHVDVIIRDHLFSEVRAKDQLADDMIAFIDRYEKDPRIDDLFVRFGDRKELAMNPNKTHSDPSGYYAFPMRRVVDKVDATSGFSMDFGTSYPPRSKTRYAHVLMAKTKPLRLQDIDMKQAEALADKMGVDLKHDGKMSPGKALWRSAHGTSSNDEKRDRWLRTGYLWLLDDTKSPSKAIIYNREPSQALFLSDEAFDVVEVVKLEDGAFANRGGHLAKRFAQLLAKEIGGKVVDGTVVKKGSVELQVGDTVRSQRNMRSVSVNGAVRADSREDESMEGFVKRVATMLEDERR